MDVQAGLDPHWSQTHYVGFVVTQLKYFSYRNIHSVHVSFVLHFHDLNHVQINGLLITLDG
jgi:hypothetical protein